MGDGERARLLRWARRELAKTTQGYDDFKRTGRGDAWIRALAALDRLAVDLEPPKPPGAPALGPILAGGRSVLLEDLTHATGGIPGYPAFDFGFGRPGALIVAPELLDVTRHGRAVRRDGRPNGRIVYATGCSGLRYAIVHVEEPALIGAKLRKGQRVAVISANHEIPHGHLGIDARSVLGRELEHHTDYTHGAPTLGEQLRKW